MKFVFFFSLLMIFYIYIGYPLSAIVLSAFRSKKVKKAHIEPYVTILIAAYNEEENIGTTIENKLDLLYPKDKLEIVVISDGSTDKTEDIVKKYERRRVRLIRQEPRAGKTSALNLATPNANGEILAFSDANSIWGRDALANLVNNFSDPNVGYVTGKMIYTNQDGTTIGNGCTLYMKYENLLRLIETRLGSIVGVDGGIDALRKNLYEKMNPDQLPDFVLPLRLVEKGYRVIFDPEAILKEPALGKFQDEYRMRVRVTLRALWGLWDMRHLLIFPRPCIFTWQLWSHKVLRYFCFVFLLGALFSNIALSLSLEEEMYRALLIGQILCYLGAVVSPILGSRGLMFKVFYPFNYFVLLNAAAAHAFFNFLKGKRMATWVPRRGK